MPSQTNEQALESTIEKALTGTTTETLNASATGVEEHKGVYQAGKGYFIGSPADFDAQYALDTRYFWHFLEQTHKKELAKLQRYGDYKQKIIDRFDRMVKKYGVLNILRNGLDVDDAHFTLFYTYPLASSSERVKENFEKNIFSVTRQIRYSVTNPLEEIDVVLFVNGLPFASMELKNPWTGQSARFHAQRQYEKRDQQQPLLSFGRCLVHLCVDTDEVYMATRLNGKKTFFLPFNKGNENGKGNPPNVNGHKSAYLWEEVLETTSVANIIQHFVRFNGKPNDALSTRTLFFPRYHQLDVVRQLIKDVSENGVGKTYLIQHSAGSGKSNSITWLAYQLIEAYAQTEKLKIEFGSEKPLIDSVIVVTDRRLLDKQLRDNIKEFSQVKNIMAPAYSSGDLRQHLENGKKIIITTIQKFPYIVEDVDNMSEKHFAVIIDEAHSSQSGIAAWKMNQVMGQIDPTEEEPDAQDFILAAIKARKMRGNASYFAFTATPKNSTLERFGQKDANGNYEPFHLYSMKQAIEEEFILDVLSNYTTFRSYYEVKKSAQENPEYETARAQKKLKAMVESNPTTIASKAEIMLDHFISKVVNTKKLKGKAKGMIVTQSIASAIHYYFAVNRILEEKGNPFKVLVAFSGTKTVKGVEYTEAQLNGFDEKRTRDKFDESEYRLLIVANKYLTGFDQPKLCVMYVDKKLLNVMAVQALSRLNRSATQLGKKKEDLFVLDFFNDAADIKKSFDPFYTVTTLSEATDTDVLHELRQKLDSEGVYEWEEVELFCERYFNNDDAQNLSPIIDTAANRFNNELELKEKDKADYKIKAKQFVKIYGQIASIIEFEVVKWEKLFWFLKFLIPKLIVREIERDDMDRLMNSVDLETYGLERTKLNEEIELDAAKSELKPQNPNPRGAHEEQEKDPLDMIIQSFNERWFQGWDATPEEQRVKFVKLAQGLRKHPDFALKYKENPDTETRKLAFNKMFDDVIAQERKSDLDLYRLIAKDEAFKQAMRGVLERILLAS